ncbi:uncharacterized protein ACBT57_005240 [Dama dama]
MNMVTGSANLPSDLLAHACSSVPAGRTERSSTCVARFEACPSVQLVAHSRLEAAFHFLSEMEVGELVAQESVAGNLHFSTRGEGSPKSGENLCSGGSQLPCCELSFGEAHVAENQCHQITPSRPGTPGVTCVSLEVDPSLTEPENGCSPGQCLSCSLARDSEPCPDF